MLFRSVAKNSYPIPPIFDMLSSDGDIEEEMMYNTFNMGIGMTVVVAREEAEKAMEVLQAAGEQPVRLGEIVAGDEGVILW